MKPINNQLAERVVSKLVDLGYPVKSDFVVINEDTTVHFQNDQLRVSSTSPEHTQLILSVAEWDFLNNPAKDITQTEHELHTISHLLRLPEDHRQAIHDLGNVRNRLINALFEKEQGLIHHALGQDYYQLDDDRVVRLTVSPSEALYAARTQQGELQHSVAAERIIAIENEDGQFIGAAIVYPEITMDRHLVPELQEADGLISALLSKGVSPMKPFQLHQQSDRVVEYINQHSVNTALFEELQEGWLEMEAAGLPIFLKDLSGLAAVDGEVKLIGQNNPLVDSHAQEYGIRLSDHLQYEDRHNLVFVQDSEVKQASHRHLLAENDNERLNAIEMKMG